MAGKEASPFTAKAIEEKKSRRQETKMPKDIRSAELSECSLDSVVRKEFND